MQIFKLIASVVGRLCLSAIFIIAGLNKILNFDASVQTLLEALSKCLMYPSLNFLNPILNICIKHVDTIHWIAMGFELIGGLLLLIGIFTRVGASLLILFLIPTTLFFHAFWELASPERDIQLVMFMKNIAILGGLFVALAFGSGFNKGLKSLGDGLV